jgi:aminoglycoside 3-N-acetyltransferase
MDRADPAINTAVNTAVETAVNTATNTAVDTAANTAVNTAVNRDELATELATLGLTSGMTVLVHASLRSMGWVDGGAEAVVAALRQVLGPDGTLVAATPTAENSDTSRDYLARIAGLTARQVRDYKRRMPAFDRHKTPAGSGRIAEAIRTMPGAIRSAHPQSSFAAIGPLARRLMRRHPVHCHLGEDSPLGKLYAAGAWILLLGVGYESCTTLHLAEYRYLDNPPRRTYRCVIRYRGQPQWRKYIDVVLDDSDFSAIGNVLDKEIVQHRGYVGSAECRLVPLRDVVDCAAEWMRAHRQLGVTVQEKRHPFSCGPESPYSDMTLSGGAGVRRPDRSRP